MPKEDDKVFDVAKPGESKPETGSKPMVVGHKIMKDPSVTESEEKESKDEQPISQTGKKVIAPISDKEQAPDNSGDDVKSEVPEKEVAAAEEAPKPEETESTTPDEDSETDSDSKKQSKEDIEKQKAEESVTNEENLQKIIAEKTYFVDIDEASYSSARTFLKTFFIVALISIIVVIVLIDLEIIDLGVTLPFDIL